MPLCNQHIAQAALERQRPARMVGNGLRNDSRTGRVIHAARTVVRNEAAAKEHSARALTALYTARPRWHR